MKKRKLLDLFCGAGGAAMGYYYAGFDEIVGIDAGRRYHIEGKARGIEGGI